ncbi:MAG: hypothetical protein K0S79_1192 [Nitrospira sp.]|jgi:hypothetical protein|nr:hypothetical protein [Nitrospira sp.]
MAAFHRAHALSTAFNVQFGGILRAQCASAEGALVRPTLSQPFS